jgi:predicted metal-dependent hydrolase
MPDFPPCQIRYSPRAKRMRLHISVDEGLVATLPRGTPVHHLHSFLDDQRDWIDRTLAELQPQRQRLEVERHTLPEQLDLQAFDRKLRISYEKHPDTRLRMTEQGATLLVRGQAENAAEIHKALGNFVRRQARACLGEELEQLSRQHQLPYRGLSIRRQKSRWGSCSASGRINLNDKLLFLPRHLMRHVLLHELAHTRHLNHSPAFYQLLHALDPHTTRHRQALKEAGKYVPLWLRWA